MKKKTGTLKSPVLWYITSGPWKYKNGRITNNAGRKTIATVPVPDKYDGAELRREANGKLLAAAPAMYDMLRSVLEECNACDDTEPEGCTVRDQIQHLLGQLILEDGSLDKNYTKAFILPSDV